MNSLNFINSNFAEALLNLCGYLDMICIMALWRIHPDLGEAFLTALNKILDLMGVEF